MLTKILIQHCNRACNRVCNRTCNRTLTFPDDPKHLKLVHHITDGRVPHQDECWLAERGGAQRGEGSSSPSGLQVGMGWPGGIGWMGQNGLLNTLHDPSKYAPASADTGGKRIVTGLKESINHCGVLF